MAQYTSVLHQLLRYVPRPRNGWFVTAKVPL